MSFRKTLSIQLGVVGVFAGAVSGFVIRDEYYFPSYKRIDDLIQEFYNNESLVDKEITELNAKLKSVQFKKTLSSTVNTKPKEVELKANNKSEKSQGSKREA